MITAEGRHPFTIQSEYEPYLHKIGFTSTAQPGPGVRYVLDPARGEGSIWLYAKPGHYFIQVTNFYLYEDFLFEYPKIYFISVGYYECSLYAEEHGLISTPYLISYRGQGRPFKRVIEKHRPVRFSSIVLAPAYYEDYLQQAYPDEYDELIALLMEFREALYLPELALLLKQLKNCKVSKSAAGLYYDSKVAEVLSLIASYIQQRPSWQPLLDEQDWAGLSAVLSYLDGNYRTSRVRLEHLSKLACMSPTKLKYTFKKACNCTISEYIFQKQVEEAKRMLATNQSSIGEIARHLGYRKTRSFSDRFRDHTGLLPKDYRKLANGKRERREIL